MPPLLHVNPPRKDGERHRIEKNEIYNLAIAQAMGMDLDLDLAMDMTLAMVMERVAEYLVDKEGEQ